MRLFFAVEIPEGMRHVAAKLSQEIRSKTPPEIKIGWVRPEHMHLTLVFMAKVPQEQLQAVREAGAMACKKSSPIEIKLAGLGAFPSFEKLQTLWVGLDKGAEGLAQLSENLRKELETASVAFDKKDFLPHLTLARNKGMEKPKAKNFVLPNEIRENLGSWTASSVTLFESKLTPYGPQHHKEIEISLG